MKKPAMPQIKVPKLPAIDFKALAEDFRTLDPKDPGLWPLAPKIVILFAIFLVALGAAGWFGWRVQWEDLMRKEEQEAKLKEEWASKKRQAINLDEHRKQLEEIDRSFGTLLKQLPNASEMESLLVDINQAGVGRGLQFELFKPGAEVSKDFYAELPITVKILGKYHDFGSFAGDIARLPRIVTLNDIDVQVPKDGGLTMQAIVKTFRYMDEEEVSRQRKAKEAAKTKGGAKK